jgi:crossover junction endodeoxyribonuclease RusA
MPPRVLSPNRGRTHWAAIHRAKKAYGEMVFHLAKQAIRRGELVLPDTDLIGLRLTCSPRASGSQPDDDNVMASFKAGRDALALAFGIDDKRFRYLMVRFDEPSQVGWIKVELEPLTSP